ncbi:MAG: peptidyl-prolyl cis-trans isomerase [Enhygromyxa sp.]
MRGIARIAVLSLATAGSLGLLELVAPAEAAAEGMVLDRIVAVVNDQIILDSDLDLWMVYDERVSMELQKLQSQNPSEEQLLRKYHELRPAALDELIGRMLMLEQAQQFQLGATEAEVEAYLQNLARNAGLGGVPELKRAVEESLRYGTWAQYRHKLREDVILWKLRGALLNVAVSDQQVLDRYRELSKSEEARLQVQRLVFRAGEDAAERDALLLQAKGVVRRLSAGEDIEDVAEELEQEVEPEEVTRSSVSRSIGERLFAAKAGDVIGPLESGQGYVVFVVEKVITSDLLGFEEAKEQLRGQIYDEVMQKGEDDLKEQLRNRAHVDIRL